MRTNGSLLYRSCANWPVSQGNEHMAIIPITKIPYKNWLKYTFEFIISWELELVLNSILKSNWADFGLSIVRLHDITTKFITSAINCFDLYAVLFLDKAYWAYNKFCDLKNINANCKYVERYFILNLIWLGNFLVT